MAFFEMSVVAYGWFFFFFPFFDFGEVVPAPSQLEKLLDLVVSADRKLAQLVPASQEGLT